MINFNHFNINILSFFISLLIFLILISAINISETKIKKEPNTLKNTSVSINNVENQIAKNEINKEEIKEWKIEIDALELKADIIEIEGTTPNKEFVGHINKTSILGQNIALIAYNFGTDKNYFANLKDLKVGDKIKYIVNDKLLTYEVILNQIIEKDELEEKIKNDNQNYNCLKLFTYVKNINNKLRYVCAKEIIDR